MSPEGRGRSRRGGPAGTEGEPGDYAYGVQPVAEALERHPERVLRVLVASGRDDGRVRRILEAARSAGVPFQRTDRRELDRRFGGRNHQGVAARVSPLGYLPVERLLEPGVDFLLVLDGVEDEGNLGAILRTAAAAGVGGVVLPTRRSAGLGPGVERASAGTAGRVPVARVGNVARFLPELSELGVRTFGAAADGETSWSEADFRGPVALVLGGEQRGLRPLVARRCDERIRIPMASEVESLNVSAAAAILAFEVVRQRRDRLRRDGR